ncbi:MAG: endonuclease/exonuclease/phosphatase family protein [Aristaeellaceae bacterium]
MAHTLTLLTLNTHSLMAPDTALCLRTLADAILTEQADAVALQEVNQLLTAPEVPAQALTDTGWQPCGSDRPVREGNFALMLAALLRARDPRWHWTWAHAHCGYDRFDEGLAVLTRLPVEAAVTRNLSTPQGACRRILLGMLTGGVWLSSLHMGWWNDAQDPFTDQWRIVEQFCREQGGIHYLLGDFNSPAHVRQEGHDLMRSCGWQDCYDRAEARDSGITVGGQIDGWRSHAVEPMRIDFVLTNAPGRTLSSRVIFNGGFYPVISDHFGVLTVETRPR